MKPKKQIVAGVAVSAVLLTGGMSVAQYVPRYDDTHVVAAADTIESEEADVNKPVAMSVEAPAPTEATEPEQATVNPQPLPSTEPVVTPKASNPYIEGTDVWYAYNRRVEAGLKVAPWGSRQTWPMAARNDGVTVDTIPAVGATVTVTPATGFAWFIGAVDKVEGNGITYSFYQNGQVTTRSATIDGSDGYTYQFIH